MRIKDLPLTTSVSPTDIIIVDQGTGNPVTRRAPLASALIQTTPAEVLTAVSGTNTIVATSAQVFAVYAAGQRFQFATAGANTGATTLNINGRGAKAVTLLDGTALTGGELPASAWVTVEYNGTAFVLVNSAASSAVTYTPAGVSAVATLAQRKLQEQVSIFDFMSAALVADVQAGTLLLDCTSAFTTALAASKNIYFPPGKYRFNSTVTITGARGLVLSGAATGLLTAGTGYTGTTEFVFDNAASGTNGIVFTDFVGVTIENILIRMRRGGAGGGKALFMYTGHDYNLRNLKVDLSVGASGCGIQIGNGSGATAGFIGNLQNCKVMAGASCPGIYLNFGTSTTLTACYVIGGWLQFDGMTYSTANSCASDASALYGYIINGSTNMVFNACGAEGASKGAFYLSTTASNILLNAPYGAANNQSADATIGDLVQLDSGSGAVNSITIINPTSVATNAATAQSIYANAGTGFVEVYNTDLTLLAKGINGHSTWLRDKLTVTGVWDLMTSWTPTLVGWTNVGSPTVTGKYKRVGKIVTFYVTVTPATSISSTLVTSTITGLPFTSVVVGSATMTDGNANSYGACVVGPTGIIYPQTSGVLSTSINFVGTVILT